MEIHNTYGSPDIWYSQQMSNKLEYLSFIPFFGFRGHWLSQNNRVEIEMKGVDGGDDDECIEQGIIQPITIIIIMNWSVQHLLIHWLPWDLYASCLLSMIRYK